MKKILALLLISLITQVFAQSVTFNKVLKTHTNTDKFLYRIDAAAAPAEFLGELEIQGFSADDVAVFGAIYKKAKEIGANAFALKPFETIDGTIPKFDAAHYRLSLFYVPATEIPAQNNTVYFFASPNTAQTIAFNDQKVTLQPRTYLKRKLGTTILTVSTRKLLGSSIRLVAQDDQAVQYFQFSAFSVNSNPYGTAGINIKSGDITRLERSYADFLTLIYQEIQEQ